MENELDALLAILLLKPHLEYFWVFSNPVEALQWTLPSHPELKGLSVLQCLSAHLLDALLADSLLPQNVQ
jgi:hypothetical protein